LEVGGIKEKTLAAHRAGIQEVLLPKNNKKDLDDIPESVQKELKFHFVEHMDEVLGLALKKPLSTVQKITKKSSYTQAVN